MRAIFISYRREDSEGQAGRLFNDLGRHFGEDCVFMDVAGIEPGRDFRRVIDEHVASCGVLLAMIGKSWVETKDESGRRRLDDASDFVRLETAAALKREIPVIPVLVHGARMPRADQLPPDLAELAYRNGVELTHARWDSDVQLLVKALSPHVELRNKNAGRTNTASPTGTPGRRTTASAVGPSVVPETASDAPFPFVPSTTIPLRTIAAGVAAALIAVAIGGYAWYRTSFPDSEMTGQVGLSEQARGQTAAAPSDAQKPAEPNLAADTPAAKPDILPTASRPATGTASELCKELDGKSIDFVGNNYRGVVGAAGIKLEKVAAEAFRFETDVMFSGQDIIQQFGKPLRDRLVGMCHSNNVITLDRMLGNGTVHHHTGSLTKAATGTIEMSGDFQEGNNSYPWSGSIAGPSRQ